MATAYGYVLPTLEIVLGILIVLGLADNLKSWDGCGWHDIDDNVVQSDSVEFDITFHLDQVP